MTGIGLLLIVIGIIFAVLGIGGSAKMRSGSLGGIIISAGAGVILIIVGALMVGYGL
jgi:hypothetical protein